MLSAGFLILIKLRFSGLFLFDYQSESVADFNNGFKFIVNIRIIHSVHTVILIPRIREKNLLFWTT